MEYNKIVSLVLLGLFISCKIDNKSNVENTIVTEQQKNKAMLFEKAKADQDNFSINIDLIANEDGVLRVLYKLNQEGKHWKRNDFKYKKSEEIQTIEQKFDLNKLGSPQKVRFFLGGITPRQIVLEKFLLSADGNIIEITSNNFEKFIYCNKYVQFNKSNNTLTTIKYKGAHLPIIELTKTALDSLNY